MDPDIPTAKNNQAWYRKQLNDSGVVFDPNNLPPLRNPRVRTGYHDTSDFKTYELLCQARNYASSQVSSHNLVNCLVFLVCVLKTGDINIIIQIYVCLIRTTYLGESILGI